jgi:hypothetical protein
MSVKAALAVLAVLASTFLTNIVWADDAGGDWLTIAESSSSLWQGKKASGHITNVGDKKSNGYVYVYQVEDKETKRYEYGEAVVLLDACTKGYGYVYYNDMQGTYTGKDAFVRFGSTVADGLGTMACTSWDNDTGKVSRQDNANGWEPAAEAKESGEKYSLKTDTVRKRSYNGKPAITALYSDHDVHAHLTTYREYVIAASDCRRGFGTIYELDFDGALSEKHDIALNGDSVISGIADTLCGKL